MDRDGAISEAIRLHQALTTRPINTGVIIEIAASHHFAERKLIAAAYMKEFQTNIETDL